ncbi:MAG: HDIG domain-containing protein [Clostridia bacterium]|nr:HDIG domain-containing protein [Clostridia bacterium]NCC74825.1 HDIG domain-containing protein [Clostridia bacterium]
MAKTREQAWELLKSYNQSESLRRHALAVEGTMRALSERFPGANQDEWGLAGLLHDLDYERYPDQHCHKAAEILQDEGYETTLIRAVMSHGYGIVTEVKPETDLEKVLYTIDELTGLVTAAALMRPSRSVLDLELKSLKKKYKTPSFAAGVDRAIIENGADMLGWTLDDVLESTIQAMRTVATEIGLDGSAAST